MAETLLFTSKVSSQNTVFWAKKPVWLKERIRDAGVAEKLPVETFKSKANHRSSLFDFN